MRVLKVFLLIVFLILAVWVQAEQKNAPDLTEEETYGMNLFKGYAGSRSCIECHEKFYKLWSTSFHGLSMQPFTAAFAKAKLTPQAHEIVIGKYRYRADISGGTGWVIEKGPDGEKKYPIEQAIGGKYVYYFLTTLERGKLQTLPSPTTSIKRNGSTRPPAASVIFPMRSAPTLPSSGKIRPTPSTRPASAAT